MICKICGYVSSYGIKECPKCGYLHERNYHKKMPPLPLPSAGVVGSFAIISLILILVPWLGLLLHMFALPIDPLLAVTNPLLVYMRFSWLLFIGIILIAPAILAYPLPGVFATLFALLCTGILLTAPIIAILVSTHDLGNDANMGFWVLCVFLVLPILCFCGSLACFGLAYGIFRRRVTIVPLMMSSVGANWINMFFIASLIERLH